MSDIHLLEDAVPKNLSYNDIRTIVIQNMAKKFDKNAHEIEYSLSHLGNSGLTDTEIEERNKYRAYYRKEYNKLAHRNTYKKNNQEIKKRREDYYNKNIKLMRHRGLINHYKKKAFNESMKSLINSDFLNEEPDSMVQEFPDTDADIFLEDINFEVLDDITPNIRKGGKQKSIKKNKKYLGKKYKRKTARKMYN
jgi:hypothetical protein